VCVQYCARPSRPSRPANDFFASFSYFIIISYCLNSYIKRQTIVIPAIIKDCIRLGNLSTISSTASSLTKNHAQSLFSSNIHNPDHVQYHLLPPCKNTHHFIHFRGYNVELPLKTAKIIYRIRFSILNHFTSVYVYNTNNWFSCNY